MPTSLRVRDRLGPAIAWAPTRESPHALPEHLTSATRVPDLYVTQAAILEIDAHLRESKSPLPFGLLAGYLCLSPRQNLVYLLVDTVSRSTTELSSADDPYAELVGGLRSLAMQQEKQGKLTIGWYLGGLADDLALDSDVTALHRELFPEPRHVLLLRGEALGVQHGAFIRFDGSSNRSYEISFYELLPEPANARSGEQRTAVQWVEYHTHEQDLQLRESDARETNRRVVTPALWHPKRLGASLRALGQALRPPVGEKPSAESGPTSTPPEAGVPYRATPERDVEQPLIETPPHIAPEQHVSAPSPSDDAVPPVDDSAEHQPPARADVYDARRVPVPSVRYIVIDGTVVPFSRTQRASRKYRLYKSARRVVLTLLLAVALVLSVMFLAYWIAR